MRLKIIGIGQCGAFVVYDFMAFLHDFKKSKELRAQATGGKLNELLGKLKNAFVDSIKGKVKNAAVFLLGSKVANVPQFVVVDGNRNNALIDFLRLDPKQVRLAELGSGLVSVFLSHRNNGCSFGTIGELAFRKECDDGSNFIGEVGLDSAGCRNRDVVCFVSSMGGGSGSGGTSALNKVMSKQPSSNRPLILNIAVAPNPLSPNEVQLWNAGRYLSRMRSERCFDGLVLFSNRDESPDEMQAVNDAIRTLLVRLANFSFPANIPVISKDLDRKDFEVFLSGRACVCGVSGKETDKLDSETLAKLVRDAVSERSRGQSQGLSCLQGGDTEPLKRVKRALVVVGVPTRCKVELDNPTIVIQEELKEVLGLANPPDCRVYSYGSTGAVEITAFLRFEKFESAPHSETFLGMWSRWAGSSKNEAEYLDQPLNAEETNGIVLDCRRAIEFETSWEDARTLLAQFKFTN